MEKTTKTPPHKLAEAVAETIGRNGEVSRLSDYTLADLRKLADKVLREEATR